MQQLARQMNGLGDVWDGRQLNGREPAVPFHALIPAPSERASFVQGGPTQTLCPAGDFPRPGAGEEGSRGLSHRVHAARRRPGGTDEQLVGRCATGILPVLFSRPLHIEAVNRCPRVDDLATVFAYDPLMISNFEQPHEYQSAASTTREALPRVRRLSRASRSRNRRMKLLTDDAWRTRSARSIEAAAKDFSRPGR
jgi:hypothetical protein